MGNETSFQSFPTHVHEALVADLSSTHAVKTIIYPKFKTRKKITFARDDLVSCNIAPNRRISSSLVIVWAVS